MPAALLRLFPDPVLRKPAQTVENFRDTELASILRTMEEMMRAQPSGIGIAAPQIGISKRIALVDVSPRDPRSTLLVLINPEIRERYEEGSSREGCMSLPDYTAQLKRYHRIIVTWQDFLGRRHEKETTGIEAVCIQHEVDHLNGILFLDRVTSLKSDMIPRGFSRKSRKK